MTETCCLKNCGQPAVIGHDFDYHTEGAVLPLCERHIIERLAELRQVKEERDRLDKVIAEAMIPLTDGRHAAPTGAERRSAMAETLAGAYVQAWVWVDGESFAADLHDTTTPEGRARLDKAILTAARDAWHEDGEIEIDDDATISLSYKGG